ncbi:hypothetical protein [Serratia liquefaciens]|uniref:hypothetical protein n=1 Tax=Serratia liquefaciens TaxID=614 RepID=UPI00235FAD00|nr:hypothetical protein [Serratia liquefaciens]
MLRRRDAILELLQKHVRQRGLAELQEQLITLLLASFTTNGQLTSWMNYMLQVSETCKPGELLSTLISREPEHEHITDGICRKTPP